MILDKNTKGAIFDPIHIYSGNGENPTIKFDGCFIPISDGGIGVLNTPYIHYNKVNIRPYEYSSNYRYLQIDGTLYITTEYIASQIEDVIRYLKYAEFKESMNIILKK